MKWFISLKCVQVLWTPEKKKMKLIKNQFWQGGSGLGVEKWCDVIGWEKTHFIKINLALCVIDFEDRE